MTAWDPDAAPHRLLVLDRRGRNRGDAKQAAAGKDGRAGRDADGDGILNEDGKTGPQGAKVGKNGIVFHVSPAALEPGTVLRPGAGEAVNDYVEGAEAKGDVIWTTESPRGALDYALKLSVNGTPPRIYAARPSADVTYAGGGFKGLTSSEAEVVAELPLEGGWSKWRTDNYGNLDTLLDEWLTGVGDREPPASSPDR